ncbi:hypothetical protein CEP53_006684 [Fusarium sp. AF-6]|nr:hypothetical protein CEP53_006684 [Fusarium sp. AF-6]
MTDKSKNEWPCVESVEDVKAGESVAVMGTVRLTEGAIVYVPTPTADPQDPLNMPMWQKYVVITMISLFSTLGLSLVSGFGGLLGFYWEEYEAEGYGDADMTALITYPTLFMGIGNLFGIPIAIAIGRRMVFLVSSAILLIGAVLCGTAKNYAWHLTARCFMSLAAGQSEALVPMITQEIFFLHERGKGLMIQNAVQTILAAVWVLFASPISGAISPQGWYYLGAGLSGLQLVLSIFLVPETKYRRSMAAFQETTTVSESDEGHVDKEGEVKKVQEATHSSVRPPLDFERFEARTWKSDMRLWVGTPEWRLAFDTLRSTFELLLFPNVLWAMCLNGLTLGANVAIGITYGGIVTSAPYNWPNSSASYVNTGQIIVALIALPLLGQGSDKIIKWRANKNGGIHEPESRIISLAIPITIGTFTAILYGQGAAHPEHYHWFIYCWALAAYFFAFVGANIVGMTYLLDSYPARAGPVLIIICAFRGIIAFGVTYGISPFIEAAGYDGAFGAFGGMTAFFGLLGIPVYIWGKSIRRFTGRFAKAKNDKVE